MEEEKNGGVERGGARGRERRQREEERDRRSRPRDEIGG